MQPLEQLAQLMYPGSRVTWIRPLSGGVSAQVTAFEIDEGSSRKQLVLRQYGRADVAGNSNVAETEFRLLKLLHERGILVPRPHYYDSSCSLYPGPVIVTDFIAGETVFEPRNLDGYLKEMARQLLMIHQIDGSNGQLSFLPHRLPIAPADLRNRLLAVDQTLGVKEVEPARAIDAAPVGNGMTLLHGDYWPGNVLWRDGRIAAIVDWEDAGVGDPLADVANCRLELIWAFGGEAMERFTSLYRSERAADFGSLPYWDLCIAVGPAANFASWTDDEGVTERRRRRFQRFIRDALVQLR